MLRSSSCCRPCYHVFNAVGIFCHSDSGLNLVAFRSACDLSEMERVPDAIYQHEFKNFEDVYNVVQIKFNKSKLFKVHPSPIKTISCKVRRVLRWFNFRLRTVAGRERFSLHSFTSSRLHRYVAVLFRFTSSRGVHSATHFPYRLSMAPKCRVGKALLTEVDV